MNEAAPQRHDLVWLIPTAARHAAPAWDCRAGRRDEAASGTLLADWIAAGRPLIVARQPEAEEPGWIRLGLALPPALGKQRIAFRLPCRAIARLAPPPALAVAAKTLPGSWQPLLRALLDAPAIAAAAPRIFGSAAMQALTGLACLGEGSDLDLLLDPPDWPAAAAALDTLNALESRFDFPRVDGEIRNPAGEAVAWRELAQAPARVLAKGRAEVRLVDRAAFAASFRASETQA